MAGNVTETQNITSRDRYHINQSTTNTSVNTQCQQVIVTPETVDSNINLISLSPCEENDAPDTLKEVHPFGLFYSLNTHSSRSAKYTI